MLENTTRDSLIAATRALLWERGYAATSPRAILSRAGVGQGSMYHHFAGKEDLAVTALERSAAEVVERATAALDGAGGPVNRLTAYLLLQRDALHGCPVGRMAADADVVQSTVLHGVLAAAFDRIRARIVAVVGEGVDCGELRPDTDPAALADTVLAVVQGGYVLARAAADPDPLDRAVRGAVALLTEYRQPPEDALNTLTEYDFGVSARNRLGETRDPGDVGAVAALETFYYALNNADLDTLAAVWSDDELAQLNNPVGGIVRSGAAITDLYRRIFASGVDVQVTFTDAAAYHQPATAVFAGREVGSYRDPGGGRTPLRIRTTRYFAWNAERRNWVQLHHHGSIDDPQALADYQAAVR